MKITEVQDPNIRGARRSEWAPLWQRLLNMEVGKWLRVELTGNESESSMRSSASKFFGKGVVSIHRDKDADRAYFVRRKTEVAPPPAAEFVSDAPEPAEEPEANLDELPEDEPDPVVTVEDFFDGETVPQTDLDDALAQAEAVSEGIKDAFERTFGPDERFDDSDDEPEGDPFFFMADASEKGPFDD